MDGQFVKQANKQASRYLSAENTTCLKGIFAICVLVHHLFQYSGVVNNRAIAFGLQSLGYLSVGMFFFYTGYGLMLSSGRTGYLHTFLRKRVIPLYVFYAFLIILYAVFRRLIGLEVPASYFWNSFLFFRGTVVPLAWYLQITIVIYVVYYIVFSLIDEDRLRLIAYSCSVVLFCLFFHYFKMESTWYESILCVLLGMIWQFRKKRFDRVLETHSLSWLVVSAILWVMALVLQKPLGIVLKMISAVMFASMVTSISFGIADTQVINNRFARFLGKHSLEIYMSQGFFLLLRRPTGIIDDPYLFIALTIIGTIVLAVIMKPLYDVIIERVRKLLRVV